MTFRGTRWTDRLSLVRSTPDSRWRSDDDGNPLMPEKQSEFLDWLLSDIKVPHSQSQWCSQNDVHERTVQGWKKDIRFKREWERRAGEKNISPDRIQDMVNTLYNAGKQGDTKAAMSYLAYVEKFMPPPTRETADKGIQGMTDEELDRAILDLMS